ncbi:hypothetical protein INT45_010331 [Circinella minor]|uniref:Major facilitator superfamily (MFS) profile domain-containing protein n=1 Tax=Circinella minor TaxID=1195481 RepID=A0A8H7VSK0_9FUNG|nr:hypothetical protein INT45_010331 [Circinella minor]
MEYSSTNVSDNIDNNTKQENLVAHNAHVVKLDPVNDTNEKCDEKPYIDPDIQKKLVRKLDLRIVAWCSLALFVNNINRYNMQNAFIMGMDKDLDIDSVAYNWAVSIYFIGFTIFKIPGNIIVARFSPRWILPTVTVLWGIVDCLISACRDYRGLLVARFMLGVVQSPLYAGAIFLFGCWYTPSELAKRVSVFAAVGMLLSGAFGGLIAGAISDTLEGVHGIASWKWLFIIEGLVSVSVGLVGFLLLGDYPHNTRWLSPNERNVAILRVRGRDIGKAYFKRSNWKTILENILLKPLTWLMIINLACLFFGINLMLNFAIILRDSGFSPSVSNYMLTPLNGFATIVSLVFAWTSDRTMDRAFHIAALQFFTAIWFLVLAVVNKGNNSISLLFVGAYATAANSAASCLGVTWTNEIYAIDNDTRAIGIAFVVAVAFIIPNFVNVKTWLVTDSPEFWLGKITCMAVSFASVVLTIVIWFLIHRQFMLPKSGKKSNHEERK